VITPCGGGAAAFSGARVFNSADQGLATSTRTVLSFNSEAAPQYDVGGYHDTATNNSRLTAPAAGYFLVFADVYFTPNATGSRQLIFEINRTVVFVGRVVEQAVNPGAESAASVLNLTTVVHMNAGDYIEVSAFQSSGSTLSALTLPDWAPIFGIVRLGS
jgi:hypothetical protein